MGGDQKGPSIFLIFKYVNKYDKLFLKMLPQVIYGFSYQPRLALKIYKKKYFKHFLFYPPTPRLNRTIKVFEVSKKADPRICFWKLHFRFSYTY